MVSLRVFWSLRLALRALQVAPPLAKDPATCVDELLVDAGLGAVLQECSVRGSQRGLCCGVSRLGLSECFSISGAFFRHHSQCGPCSGSVLEKVGF